MFSSFLLIKNDQLNKYQTKDGFQIHQYISLNKPLTEHSSIINNHNTFQNLQVNLKCIK